MSEPAPKRSDRNPVRAALPAPPDDELAATMPPDPTIGPSQQAGETVCEENARSTGAGELEMSIAPEVTDFPATEFPATLDTNTGFMETLDQVRGETKRRAAAVLHTQVGDYEIERELGRGGMGVVYKARHRQLRRDVALKMILAGRHAGPDQLERFLTEARAVAQLQHPNIVQIFDIGEHEGLPYFSLEFVDGQSLAQFLDKHPQPPDEAGRVLELLARAMQYAHDHGVLHRDLKPANVLLTKEGVPKITDFGLAKKVDDDESASTRTGTVMGTPSYMSPEQALGMTHEVGPAADQYSLGALLYEMLTGRPPFLASRAVDTILQVIHDEPVQPRQLQPTIPVDLETICLKALQKEPEKRYASCLELAEDARRFREGIPILARPVGNLERVTRWCRRNPRVAIPSIIALFLLVVVAFGMTWSYVTVSRQNIVITQERNNAKTAEGKAQEAKKQAEIEAANAKTQAGIAKERAQTAKKQAELAMKNMQLVIDEIDSKVSKLPGMLEVRLSVLGTIVKAWDQIDASVRDEEEGEAVPTLMAARMKLANIFSDVGKLDLADQEYGKLYEIAKRRVEIKHGNDASRRNMASICLMLGQVREQVNRDPQRSLKHYEEALNWIKDVDEHPKPDDKPGGPKKYEIKNILGESLQRVGTSHLAQGRLTQASDYFAQALELRRQLVVFVRDDAVFAAEPEFKRKSALAEFDVSLDKSLLAHANVAFRQGKVPEAQKLYEEAFDRRKRLFEANPNDPKNKTEYARFCGSFGEFFYWTSRHSEARPLLENSTKLLGEVVAANPTNANYKSYLSTAHYRLGCFLDDQTDEAALKEFQACRTLREAVLQESSDNQKKQSEWMMALARCRDVEQASQLAEKLGANTQPDPELHLERARALAQCSRHVPADKREAFVNAALDALDHALGDGYADPFKIQHEPDLKPLRDDPRFATVLAKMQQK